MKQRMLLIIDPQVDFVTGALKVEGAGPAMHALAGYIGAHGHEYAACVITADWHPADHISFDANGGIWPPHCIAFSVGAAIYAPVYEAALRSCRSVRVLTKGLAAGHEEYSIFANRESSSALDVMIASQGIERIDLCGIAGDVCVSDTLLDGISRYGNNMFNVLVEFCPSIDGGKRLGELAEKINNH